MPIYPLAGQPAFASALEVLAANGVEVMTDADEGYPPIVDRVFAAATKRERE